MCGLLNYWMAPPTYKVSMVWRSLGFDETVDIQEKFREVWGLPYVALPDDRSMKFEYDSK